MELKVLLADDEAGILAYLESILIKIPGISIVGKMTTVQDALLQSTITKPDIALLDIQFPDGLGIDLAKELLAGDPNLDIVFITAHDGFALEAFDLYSYDYILKPIDENRVIRTIKRLKKKRQETNQQTVMEKLGISKRLTVRSGQELVFINTDDIIFLERLGKDVIIHGINSTYQTNDSLSELELKLDQWFFRSHKSYIVNLRYVEKIISWNNNTYQICFAGYDKKAGLSRHRTGDLLKKITK